MMLDKYFYGNAERVSPEAPVLVLHYQSEELRLGGAANVCINAGDAQRQRPQGSASSDATRQPMTFGNLGL